MEASIARDAHTFVADTESCVSYLQILCIWQKGADGLLDSYRQLEKRLPSGNNLETMVLTKEELMRKVKVKDEETTTHQINEICKNLSLVYQVALVQMHMYFFFYIMHNLFSMLHSLCISIQNFNFY